MPLVVPGQAATIALCFAFDCGTGKNQFHRIRGIFVFGRWILECRLQLLRTKMQRCFLTLAYVRPAWTRLREGWANPAFGASGITVQLGDDQIAIIENWEFDEVAQSATVHHFRVHSKWVGKGMGEPLLRGFAAAVKKRYGVNKILFWETHQHVPGYTVLFARLGAVQGGIAPGGYQEWIWHI